MIAEFHVITTQRNHMNVVLLLVNTYMFKGIL
jgi:hypothetical protein